MKWVVVGGCNCVGVGDDKLQEEIDDTIFGQNRFKHSGGCVINFFVDVVEMGNIFYREYQFSSLEVMFPTAEISVGNIKFGTLRVDAEALSL